MPNTPREVYVGSRSSYRLLAGLRRLRLEESGGADFYGERKDAIARSPGTGVTRVQAGPGPMVPWKRDLEAENLQKAADATDPKFIYLRKQRQDRAAELAWAKRFGRERDERDARREDAKRDRRKKDEEWEAEKRGRVAALRDRWQAGALEVQGRQDPEWKEPNRHMLPSQMSWPRDVTLWRRTAWYMSIRAHNIRNDEILAEFVKANGWRPDELRRSEYSHGIVPMEYRDWLIQTQWQEDRKAEEEAAERFGENVAKIREWVEQGVIPQPRWGDV